MKSHYSKTAKPTQKRGLSKPKQVLQKWINIFATATLNSNFAVKCFLFSYTAVNKSNIKKLEAFEMWYYRKILIESC